MGYHDLRDETGKFAPAAAANGGGASFASPDDADWGETRSQLTKNATSQKSSAPNLGSAETLPSGTELTGDAASHLAAVSPPGQSEFNAEPIQRALDWQPHEALRATGYGPEEGDAHPDLSARIGTSIPPANLGSPGHPAPRINFGGFQGQHPRPDLGESPFGGGDDDDF